MHQVNLDGLASFHWIMAKGFHLQTRSAGQYLHSARPDPDVKRALRQELRAWQADGAQGFVCMLAIAHANEISPVTEMSECPSGLGNNTREAPTGFILLLDVGGSHREHSVGVRRFYKPCHDETILACIFSFG